MMPAPATPEVRLAAFCHDLADDDIPSSVRQAALRAILNVIGTMLAGAREPAVETALAVLTPHSAPGKAVLASRSNRADLLLAAFANAMAANIHDFDDTHMPTIMHPSSPVLPALLAMASVRKISGPDLLRAFVVGVEVECRIAMAVSPSHYARGWHITSTCGIFGSAAACGHLLRLSPEQMRNAFSIAAVQACGMVEALGTMAKSVSVGNASRGGLVASQLAAQQFDGPEKPLTGVRGFLPLYGDNPTPGYLAEGLGCHWAFDDVAFKPYPVGVVLNPVIDAGLELHRRGIADPATIVGVTFHGHPLLRERADRPAAATGRLSQVSAQHALTIAMKRGRAGLAEFDDAAAAETLNQRPVCAFLDDPNRDPSSVCAAIRTMDETEIFVDIPAARGSLRNPMSDRDLEEKLRANAERADLAGRAEDIIRTVWSIDSQADASNLAELCAAGGAGL